MNKEQAAWSLLIAGMLLVCIWMVNGMSEQLDDVDKARPVAASQDISDPGGVTTERERGEGGDWETLDSWAIRHRAAVAKFGEDN